MTSPTTSTQLSSPAQPSPSTPASNHESRNVAGFSVVELRGIGNATIEQNGTESLTITADADILPLLTSDVSAGVLRLGIKPNTSISTRNPITYRVTAKDLRGLSVSGTGSIIAERITTDRLSVTISGSGKIKIGGTADSQELHITGAGDYQAADLISKAVNATITGSGDADITVSQTLTATILGSGSITYDGNPKISQQVLGSGAVARK
ncbi:MAG TPA: head GIN domain-containing protein [Pseudonocardiaceae bacterium]